MTRSAFKSYRPVPYADDPTLPPARATLTSHHGPVPDDAAPDETGPDETGPGETGPDETGPRALLAPDAFKGTADATSIAAAMAAGAGRVRWGCDPCPLSDGGEGFAQVLAAVPPSAGTPPGRWYQTEVTGPLGRPVLAQWWLAGGVAVVESAAASGLPLAGGARGNDPLGATTRGTGELLVAAVAAGARRVLVGVGGSATTDGGRGAIEAIEAAGGLGRAEVVVACDVETRFVDAAQRFGPQKGASPTQVAQLEARLAAFATRLRDRYGVDVADMAGSGAAGGLAGGLAALGARLVPGFGVVAESVGLADRLGRVDLVVTGEGRLDATSWAGKVVGGVVRAARLAGVPVLVVPGALGPGGIEGAVPSGPGGGTDVEVRSLTDLVGEARAMGDPTGAVEEVVAAALAERR
jgi:glycerate kinase